MSAEVDTCRVFRAVGVENVPHRSPAIVFALICFSAWYRAGKALLSSEIGAHGTESRGQRAFDRAVPSVISRPDLQNVVTHIRRTELRRSLTQLIIQELIRAMSALAVSNFNEEFWD
ncbi:unnamed protein product [Cylicostephanus goldi]|uniref:Uncharacterized protein n=1 Tax=Cylicostephanus goldi TaxID=71465 RepID=A0A3P6Q5J5_CYLGO|nr:unnamed protein product [Cylicostephanus goldi]